MNLSEIARLIEKPAGFKNEQIPALKSLMEKYPYAQSFAIIYLKALSDLQSIHFEDELKKYACSITNRALLFNLIHNQLDEEVVSVETPKVSTEEIPVEEKEAIEIEQVNVEIQQGVVEENLPIKEEKTVAEIDWSNIVEVIDTTQTVENEPKKDTTEHSPLDIDILNSAFSSGVEHHTDEFIPIKESKEVKEEVVNENESTTHKLFIDWLNASKNSFKPAEVKNEKESIKKSKINELIEGFIEKEPSIGKIRSDFFSAHKNAQESVQEEMMPVSPTLAKIFAIQGNFPKSIAIYQQLILKYPEKKSFFASQISELEKKLNS